jgi:hypothetical protein
VLPLINQQGRKPALAETLRRGDLPGRLESMRSALPPALRLRARASSFGTAGVGGSRAWANPELELAFALMPPVG